MNISTNRIIADYTELVNKELDRIPIRNEEDFEIVIEALKSITESTQNHIVPDSLKERIDFIRDFIKQPELYALPQHQDPFKQLVLERVASKIQELAEFNLQDKERYISDQNGVRQETAQKQAKLQEKLTKIPAPAQKLLEEMTRREMRQEDIQAVRSFINEKQGVLKPREINLLEQFIDLKISPAKFWELFRWLQVEIIQNFDAVRSIIMHRKASFEDIIAWLPETRKMFFDLAREMY